MLTNKNILIVGGATGIGRATADICTQRGAKVFIADMTRPEDWSGKYFEVDITKENEVRDLFTQVGQEFDSLDALIQTAGILKGQYVPLSELDVDVFRNVWEVNVTGSFLCAKHAEPLLKKSSQAVVVLFSSGAATGGSSSLAYGSSKGGVNGLFNTLEKRLAAENIRVNVISPGNIDTPMKRSVIAVEADKSGTSIEEALAQSSLGSAEGVARVAAWLVSEDASYVRGIITTR